MVSNFWPAVDWSRIHADGLLFGFQDDKLLLHFKNKEFSLPTGTPAGLGLAETGFEGPAHYFGDWGDIPGRPCFLLPLKDDFRPPAGMKLRRLRSCWGQIPAEDFWLAARAYLLARWFDTHRYCGRCGATTGPGAGRERFLFCENCRLKFFPRLSPSVIVLVKKGDEALLARSPHFPPGLISILAGFVEPGETLETACIREIREEVGLNIHNLVYYGSQPWPFPDSLMLGFTAEYHSGDLVLEEEEITEADWYPRNSLPKEIPGEISIAGRMLRDFAAGKILSLAIPRYRPFLGLCQNNCEPLYLFLFWSFH